MTNIIQAGGRQLRVTGVNFLRAIGRKQNHIVRFWRNALSFHSGRTDGHPCDSQANGIGFFGKQAIDFGHWNMPFDHVAIHDGSVARLEFGRHLILNFDGRHILHIVYGRVKAVIFDVLNPIATTTSGRRAIDGDWNPA